MKTNDILHLVDKYIEVNDKVADEKGIPVCVREYISDVLKGFKDYITEIEDLTNTKKVV